MLKKLGWQFVVVLIGALFFNVHAQTTTVGTISGTVRDEKGAVVPKAEKRELLFPRPRFLFRVRALEYRVQ